MPGRIGRLHCGGHRGPHPRTYGRSASRARGASGSRRRGTHRDRAPIFEAIAAALAAVLEALQVLADALPVLWMHPELAQYISRLAHSLALVALTFGRIF